MILGSSCGGADCSWCWWQLLAAVSAGVVALGYSRACGVSDSGLVQGHWGQCLSPSPGLRGLRAGSLCPYFVKGTAGVHGSSRGVAGMCGSGRGEAGVCRFGRGRAGRPRFCWGWGWCSQVPGMWSWCILLPHSRSACCGSAPAVPQLLGAVVSAAWLLCVGQ